MSVEVPEDKMKNLNVNATSVIKETPEDKEGKGVNVDLQLQLNMINMELSNKSLLLNEKNTSTEKTLNEKGESEKESSSEGEEKEESSSEGEEEESSTTSLNPIKDEVNKFKLHVQVDVYNQTSFKE